MRPQPDGGKPENAARASRGKGASRCRRLAQEVDCEVKGGMDAGFREGLDEKQFALRPCTGDLRILSPSMGSVHDYNADPDNSRKFQRPCRNLGQQWGHRAGEPHQQLRPDANQGVLSFQRPVSLQHGFGDHLQAGHRPGHRPAHPGRDRFVARRGAAWNNLYQHQCLWRSEFAGQQPRDDVLPGGRDRYVPEWLSGICHRSDHAFGVRHGAHDHGP